jgi:hypothetical protein
MAVYRLIALLADPNALRCVHTQVYQARDLLLAKVALHFFSFLALATHKKGYSTPRRAGIPLQKKHKKAATAAFLCVASVSVKRSRLLLPFLSFGFASASS